MKNHEYAVRIQWTGNDGEGTRDYRSYRRDHTIGAPGKPDIPGSSDPAFRGDAARYNPEELLVAAFSACHMLWYLHLCATSGVRVVAYEDAAEGSMAEDAAGAGKFVNVRLYPRVTIAAEGDVTRATGLHEEAHRFCFISNSVDFPVEIHPSVQMVSSAADSQTC